MNATKLVIAAPGYWQRSSGDTVAIGEMEHGHLIGAFKKCEKRLLLAMRTRTQIAALQESFRTMTEAEESAEIAEVDAIVQKLDAKRSELLAAIGRHNKAP